MNTQKRNLNARYDLYKQILTDTGWQCVRVENSYCSDDIERWVAPPALKTFIEFAGRNKDSDPMTFSEAMRTQVGFDVSTLHMIGVVEKLNAEEDSISQ